MATFGQGINPQLGAIDYSPILKGSVAGAEMAAKGGQMIGQGLANLGQEVGKGVETYFKKQDMMKAQIGEITAFALSDPEYLATLPPKFLEDAKAGNLKPREVTEVYAAGAMSRKIKNDVLQNNYITAQTNALNAKSNDEAAQRQAEANKRAAGVLVGNAYRNKATSLDLTGVDPEVAALAAPEFLRYATDAAQQKAFIANQDRIAGAPEKILNSYLKPEFVELAGKKLHKTYDANGIERYDEVTPSYQQKLDLQQSRLSTLLDTIADAENRNDLETASRGRLQVLAEFSGLAQTPSELNRILKPFREGRAKNINERLPAGVTQPAASGIPLNAQQIAPSNSVAPAALAPQTTQNYGPTSELPAYRNGVLVQPEQPVAPLPNRSNIQQAGEGSVQPRPAQQQQPSFDPYGGSSYGDDRGSEQSDLGASSVTPAPTAARPTAPSAPSVQAAKLTAGASKAVSSVLDRADEIYIGAEVLNSVFNDPKLRKEVKDLAKKASGKLQFLSKYLGSKTGKILGAGKQVVGKVARPAMIINSADKIIGKYVARDFPDVDHQRVSSAVMENVTAWFDSQNRTTKDETMALLAQKSKYLMGSNMSREAKLAKNAELLKLMAEMQLRSSTIYPERYIQLGQ